MIEIKKARKGGLGAIRRDWGAIIYARFSPRKNAEDCESIGTQLDYCRAYCREKGYRVIAEYKDHALSGDDFDRPALWGAVEKIKNGDILVSVSEDRLARSVLLAEIISHEVRSKGGRLEMVRDNNGDTDEDQLLRGILRQVREYEKKCISARTKAAMSRHQTNGRIMGSRVPFGWVADKLDDRLMRKDSTEQTVIQTIRDMRMAGRGYAFIAGQFNQNGIKAKNGGLWYGPTVRQIEKRLEREELLGIRKD